MPAPAEPCRSLRLSEAAKDDRLREAFQTAAIAGRRKAHASPFKEAAYLLEQQELTGGCILYRPLGFTRRLVSPTIASQAVTDLLLPASHQIGEPTTKNP